MKEILKDPLTNIIALPLRVLVYTICMHAAVCANCGQECEVPFKPDPDRPVYCRECYSKRRRQSIRY